MDGRQTKVAQSLQFRLSVWLLLVILLVALAGGAFSYVWAFQEAIELQDDQLKQMAALINRQELLITHVDSLAGQADPESHVALQLLRQANGQAAPLAGELPGLAVDLPEGIQTTMVQNRSWRLFVKTLDSGARIAVGQQTAARDEIARDSALRTLMPFLILIPILLLLVGDLIGKMFRPLKKMAEQLDRRSEEDLREISNQQLPTEIRPFVVAINRLLSRIAQSMSLQRRFVADAAHELRTPLTALSLQAERLAAAEMSAVARERLEVLCGGIQRTRGLLDQLLTLARVQELSQQQTETVSLQQIFRQVLEELLPLAEAKSIDVGVVGEADANVCAPALDLKTLVKNLVDNAIRYTPQGGHIDLCVLTIDGRVVLQIDDSGGGIPEQERGRVFDPFYRILGSDAVGSGLGLAIVKTIAVRIAAQITLAYIDEKTRTGLRVRVMFPRVDGIAAAQQ